MNSGLIGNLYWIRILITLLFVWILLFEFILPVNEILPAPTTVIDTSIHLFIEYNLLIHLLSTVGVVYLSIAIGFFLTFIFRNNLLNEDSRIFKIIFPLGNLPAFIPLIFIAIFFVYWFPGSELIEFVFALLIIFFSHVLTIGKSIKSVNEELLVSSLSFGLSKKVIRNDIIWKSILPKLREQTIETHSLLWTIILTFEFIKGGYGVGAILKMLLEVNDLSGITAVIIIALSLILILTGLSRYLLNKLIFWDSNE
ncbi:MAG: ABC transporter permease subunit [Ignavibacteriales bacterium]|nr:MAG: ABC transporter permease subunit [Ignavibacteriales bacterium]